jgi:hypothetical protein
MTVIVRRETDEEYKSSDRNRKHLLKIADRLDVIARNLSLTGGQIRKETEEASKTYLHGPWTSATRMAFNELQGLRRALGYDDAQDDYIRQKIAECANLVRHHLGE